MSLDFLRQLASLVREQDQPQQATSLSIADLLQDEAYLAQDTAAPADYMRPIPQFPETGVDGQPMLGEVTPLENAPSLGVDDQVTPQFVRSLIAYFTFTCSALMRQTALALISKANDMFAQLPTLVDVTVASNMRAVVLGDIHGQYFDMLHALRMSGVSLDGDGELLPPDLMLFFLGDYVDRGDLGSEVVLTLCALKLLYPDRVHMIRGNHECRPIFSVYGFSDEVTRKYGEPIIDAFAELFRHLPLALLINRTVFAVHAAPPVGSDVAAVGLGLNEIRALHRVADGFVDGSAADELLWSDPNESFDKYLPYQDFMQTLMGNSEQNEQAIDSIADAINNHVERLRRELLPDGAPKEDALPDRLGVWARGPNPSTTIRTESMKDCRDESVIKMSARGAGVNFSYAVIAAWMRRNGITMVIRGHQAQQGGWARHWPLHAERDGLEFWTIFSAADYNQTGNRAAYLVLHLAD